MNYGVGGFGSNLLCAGLLVGLVACSDANDDQLGVDAGTGRDLSGADAYAATDTAPLDVGLSDASAPDQAVPVPGPWVTISAGTFMMGSPESELCRNTNEDQHQVTLTHSFEIQSTEVTQAEFSALMGYNPSEYSSCGTTCPVDATSWHMAVAYCNALSLEKGLARCYSCTGSKVDVMCSETLEHEGANIYACPGYRLPTEAEWEYAYRAGTKTALYNGAIALCDYHDSNADKIAWFMWNSKSSTHPVGQKLANAWYLYDMAGNVREWCHDEYSGSLGSSAVTDPWGSSQSSFYRSRVVRGGAHCIKASALRAASRGGIDPDTQWLDTGFRCVRTK